MTFADGTAEWAGCEAREVERLLAAAERAVESADARADEAEVTLAGGALP